MLWITQGKQTNNPGETNDAGIVQVASVKPVEPQKPGYTEVPASEQCVDIDCSENTNKSL